MASKKSRGKTPRPFARWYLDTGKDAARDAGLYAPSADPEERANYLAAKRELRIRTLSQNIKRVRQVFPGFDPASGYDLHDVRSWPKARVKRIAQYAEYVNHLRSQPFTLIRPRNRAQREALREYTGQRLPEQKAFIVHKDMESDRVQISRDGEIFKERTLPAGGLLRSEFYFFSALLGYRPVTWDEVYVATVEMLPLMPDGDYFIYSELHGEISTPHAKRMLPRLIQRMIEEEYDEDMAGTIIGFKRVADNVSPDKEYEQIYFRRQEATEERRKAWNRLRRRAERKFKRR